MSKVASFSEEQLKQLGIAVVGDEAVPVQGGTPDDTWSLDQLALYANGQIAESVLQSHKSAVALFRAGRALGHARTRCKEQGHGVWADWKRQHGLADTTANDAIRLYEGAGTEEALAGMGITEAKQQFVYPDKDGPSTPSADENAKPLSQSKRTASRRRAGAVAPRTAVEENGGSEGGDDTPVAAAGDAGDPEPQTLPEELEKIAQRVNEIVQNGSGKIDWSVVDYKRTENAAQALAHASAELLRWLGQENHNAA